MAEDGVVPEQDIDFCTLGMFIIDEIHYLPPKPPVFDILGGAGSYSALGARLFSPPPLSKTVSWIVDSGSDFPPSISTQIDAWQTTCHLRFDPTRLTTRGWNGYDSSQNRAFKYTTPKLRLDQDSLTPSLLLSKSFHLICSPLRCQNLVSSILRSRKKLNPYIPKPLFIWEPVPDLCTPSELLNTTNTLPYIDICSPNHSELASLMGDTSLGIDPITSLVSKPSIEKFCEQLLSSMPLQSYSLIIRCGASGCYIAKNGGRSRRPSFSKQKKHPRPANRPRGGLTMDMDMESLFSSLLSNLGGDGSFDLEAQREREVEEAGIDKWFPAYFEGEEGKERVVDPTGGGNGFLGGLAVGLARGRGLQESVAMGSVAASFAIEQVGMPVFGEGGEGEKVWETWNGVRVEERFEEYMKRAKIGRTFP